MNALLSIPIELRMAGLFVLGAFLGSLANAGAYRLAWNPRPIGPWSPRHPNAPPRHWTDAIPLFGWLGLRRESPLHGRGYWLRPVFVELCVGFGLAWLYWWEVDQFGLIPPALVGRLPGTWMLDAHIQFVVHSFLIWLMLTASLIDIDEKTIPDAITVGGTLVGLIVVAIWPETLLPNLHVPSEVALILRPWPLMNIAAPYAAPEWLGPFPRGASLAIGLGCWWLWCFGLMRRDWYTRHGLVRACRVFSARLARDPSTWRITVLGLAGSLGITSVWCWGQRSWEALLTALIGMAAAGGLVWTIRIIGARVMGREAMGFGDVTLMAMIGVFIGWQAAVMAFFVAPVAALVVGLLFLFFRGETEIYYGPFICLSTFVFLVRWDAIWRKTEPWFSMGPLVPLVLIVCLCLLAFLLWVIQRVKRLFR